MRTIFLLTVVSALFFATVINIPADYPTIRAWIDNSVGGDTSIVAPGIYTEKMSISETNLVLSSHYCTGQYYATINTSEIDCTSQGSVVSVQDNAEVKFTGFSIINGQSSSSGTDLYR